MSPTCTAQHTKHPGLWDVPCVRADMELGCQKGPNQEDPQWWPIIGPWHEDRHDIEFPHNHWHIDWRFVDRARRERVEKSMYGAIIARVIVAEEITAFGAPRCERDENELPKTQYRRWLTTRRLNLVAASVPRWGGNEIWRTALERRYSNANAKQGGRLVCPHRGADLTLIAPIRENIVECPLHGLLWCTRTGRHIDRMRFEDE